MNNHLTSRGDGDYDTEGVGLPVTLWIVLQILYVVIASNYQRSFALHRDATTCCRRQAHLKLSSLVKKYEKK